MSKNKIIENIVEELLEQRKELNQGLIVLNYNEANYLEKKSTFENAIMNIDMQLDRRVVDCTPNV